MARSTQIINGTLVLTGELAGAVTLASQSLGGSLVFLLPNAAPITGQLMTAVSVNGDQVILGWTTDQTGGGSAVASVFGRVGAVVAASNDYNFNQLAGSLTIAQINSKQGNGNAVQLTNTGATTNGGVVTYDGVGNTQDSGILVAGLAPRLNPTFISSITTPVVNATGGGDLTLTAAGSNKVSITTATGTFNFFGTGGGMSLTSQTAHINIANTGGISIVPASGTEIQLGNTALQSALHDGTDATGTAGQVLTSTGGGTPTTLWSNSAVLDVITSTGAGTQIKGNGVRGIYVNLAPGPTDGVFIWDNTGANAFTIGAAAGGILAATSGNGNIALSTGSVTGTNGNVALDANLHVTSANADVKGTITVTNPATSQTFSFGRAYASAPKVVVTPTSDSSVAGIVAYWVTSTGADFTVHVNTTPGSSITFNYLVIG